METSIDKRIFLGVCGNEKVFGVVHTLTLAAIMDSGTEFFSLRSIGDGMYRLDMAMHQMRPQVQKRGAP